MVKPTFENIYDCLRGDVIEEEAIPWVGNAFREGGLCDREYHRMRQAYDRICVRLGIEPEKEDEDLNILLESCQSIEKELCHRIFTLGRGMNGGKMG